MTDDSVDTTAHVVTTIDLGDGMVITVRRPAVAATPTPDPADDDGPTLADRVAVLEGTVADLLTALAASVGMPPAQAADLPVVTPAGVDVPSHLAPPAAADAPQQSTPVPATDDGDGDPLVQTPPQPQPADSAVAVDPLVAPPAQANSNVAAPFDLTGIGTPPLAPDAPGQG